MERTTLTRNLRPLTRVKWVITGTGKDRRQHLLQLTAAGRRKLVRSLSLWEEAQRQFLSQIGTESLQELRTLIRGGQRDYSRRHSRQWLRPKSREQTFIDRRTSGISLRKDLKGNRMF
jgi:hypothetical protein